MTQNSRICKVILGLGLLVSGYKGTGQSNYRPKIAEFGIEKLTDYNAITVNPGEQRARTEVENDLLIKSKLAIPILIKPDRAFGLQLKYNQHRFLFDQEDYGTDDEFLDYLGNRNFYSAGVRFFYKENINWYSSIRFFGGVELNNDEFRFHQDASKYFASVAYTVQRSSTEEIGAGLVASQALGQFTVLPIFTYNNHFSPRWIVDLVLPKSAALRYVINKRTYLSAKTEFKGWRYNVTDSMVGEQENLTLRKTDLQFNLALEREIHDWLWFGVEMGYNKNLQYFLVEPGGRARDAIVELTPRDAGYLKASIFIVPPRKLFGR